MNRKKRLLVLCAAAAAIVITVFAALSSASTLDCPDCGSTSSIRLPDGTSSANCMHAWYADYKCLDCGREWRYTIREKTDHKLDIGATTKQPTCTQEGTTTYTCTYGCGYTKDEPIARLAHDPEPREGTDPTCTSPGTARHYACSVCGTLFRDELAQESVQRADLVVPAAGHTWETKTMPASCTSGGYDEKTCSVCGTSGPRENLTEPIGHMLTRTEGHSASCTDEGTQDFYTCSVCGAVFTDPDGIESADGDNTVVPALGHVLRRTAGAEPSCTEDGVAEHWTCTRCSKMFRDADGLTEVSARGTEIDPTGHRLAYTAGKDATCETDGSLEYWHCTQCGLLFSDEQGGHEIAFEDTHIPAPGHKLEHFTEKEAGEDEDGYCEHWKCTVCGKLFGDGEGCEEVRPEDVYVPATGHTLVHEPGTAPTCTEDGTKEHYRCTGCGALYLDADGQVRTEEAALRIAAAGHSEVDKVYPPDCLKDGYTEYTCTECGAKRQAEAVPALGHDLRYVEEKPAAEDAPGIHGHFVCDRCGLLFRDSDGHDEVRDPAALEIPATGHTYEETVVEPTCTENGYTEHTCTGCSDTYRDNEVAAAGHTLTQVPEVPATEDEEGTKEHWKCETCGELFFDASGTQPAQPEDLRIPAISHTYTDTVVPPTCTEPGYTEHVCDDCGKIYQDEPTDPLGHTLREVPEEPAGPEEDGKRAHFICETCGEIFEDAEGTKPVENPEDLVIPATGHNYAQTVVAPDCTNGGYTEYVCEDCGKTYQDELKDPLGHSMTRYPAQAPTLTREGNIEYWKCDRCGLYFTDSEGSATIAPEDVVRPRLDKDPGGGDVETGDTKDPFLFVLAGAAALALIFLAAAARRRAGRDDAPAKRTRESN